MEGKATGLGGNGKENERRRRLLHTAEKKKEVEEVSKSLGPGPARRGSTSYIVRKKKARKEGKSSTKYYGSREVEQADAKRKIEYPNIGEGE